MLHGGWLAPLAAILILAGSLVGAARLAAIDAPAKKVHDGRVVSVRAHLLTHPRPSPFGSSAEVRVASGALRGVRLLVRAPRRLRFGRGAGPGAELALGGTLRKPRSGRHGDFDFADHLRRKGIAGELVLERMRATTLGRQGVGGAIDRVRARAERALAAGMPAREAALARGMVLGQDESVEGPLREDFRASGLSHMLAVSGQNVMLLVALALPALAMAGASREVRIAALLALIALYVPLAGAGPSLQRAGVMGAAGLVAVAASRPASRSYALVLAAAITLAVNPRAWGDPGWQLSFAAVVGILLLAPPLRRALLAVVAAARTSSPEWGVAGGGPGGFVRALVEGVAISIAASLATAPLLAHHFGSVPLAGLPANVLALPAVAPAMWLGMVTAAVGQLSALGVPGPAVSAAVEALGALTRAPIAYLAWLAERCAELPALVRLPLGSPAALVAAYAGLAATLIAIAHAGRRLEPRAAGVAAAWRRWPPRRRVALACLALAGAAALTARLMAPPPIPGRLTISFLDVGQGDATLIQHPDGTAVLFDGGPPEGRVARLLRQAGVRRLSAVVATHASRDHHGGLPQVLERYPVDVLLDGGDGTTDPGFRSVLRAAAERGTRRVAATAPMTLRVGTVSIRVLSPPPRPPGPAPEDPNSRAVVAVVSVGRFDLLLSADAESEALAPLALPDVEAMKVPHHGSSDPGLPEVLDRLRPEVAAIEVGEGNSYGHPAPTTLAALRAAHTRIYRTDRDGTVRLTVNRSHVSVKTDG